MRPPFLFKTNGKFQIEVASARAELYNKESRKPKKVINTDLEGDLIRRDFTINAMAIDLRSQNFGELTDPFGGINDIGLPGLLNSMEIPTLEVTAEQIISEHKRIIARIKQNGLIAIGGALTPSGGFAAPAYFEEASNAKRQTINDWIRNSHSYDYVVDFDAVLRDPNKPHLIKTELTADGLHPNSAGYQKMAAAAYVALEPSLPQKP